MMYATKSQMSFKPFQSRSFFHKYYCSLNSDLQTEAGFKRVGFNALKCVVMFKTNLNFLAHLASLT